MLKYIPAITVASLLSATSAFAQAETQTAPSPSDPPAMTEPAPSTTPSVAPAPSTSTTDTTAAVKDTPMMTDDEAKNWVNKTVYSSDGKKFGEVAAILRDSSGHVTELHADIGGFLGLGETRVKVLPDQFKVSSDRVILNIAGDQAKNLPHLEK